MTMPRGCVVCGNEEEEGKRGYAEAGISTCRTVVEEKDVVGGTRLHAEDGKLLLLCIWAYT